MGKEIFLGRREKALRLYFTPSKHDDQKTRKLKRCVTENWGRWEQCAGMGFGEYGRILAYLAEHRGAYHQALERIDRRFLVFVLNAYQSFLFNEVLARWLRDLSAERGFSLRPLRSAYGSCELYDTLPPGAAAELRQDRSSRPGIRHVHLPTSRVRGILGQVLEDRRAYALSDLQGPPDAPHPRRRRGEGGDRGAGGPRGARDGAGRPVSRAGRRRRCASSCPRGATRPC